MCAGHPNIVQLQEVFLTDKHLAIVMEHAGAQSHRLADTFPASTSAPMDVDAVPGGAAEQAGQSPKGYAVVTLRPFACADGGDMARYVDALMRHTVRGTPYFCCSPSKPCKSLAAVHHLRVMPCNWQRTPGMHWAACVS